MKKKCFLKQEATVTIIENVASVCSECYSELQVNEVIFYDMQNYCYLCSPCQEVLDLTLDENCEPLESLSISLF